MNTTKYLQTDSRWSELGYPQKPCTIGNSGCGEVAICNCIIEMEKYKNCTPAVIQPYCKQYAAPNCDGTYWSGIPAMMKAYAMTEVKEHQTMPELFKELAKGDRVAIYLMGSRRAGSKGIHWTSSGHFICSVDYRYQNGEHEVYVKDSNSNSKDRNGWLGYRTHLYGDVLKVWSGKLSGKLTDGRIATEVKGTSKVTTPTKYKVIDVSEWQGEIDWKKVKADGIIGAIIRYADGDYIDKYFSANMKNAKANGLHIGAYIYSRAKTDAQARTEARLLFNSCKQYNPDLPLYIDLEQKGLEKYANTVANAFIDEIKKMGGFAGVYANLNWWNNYLTKVTPPARWVAQYYSKCEYKGSYGMWQYSSDGRVSGINGRVDMDWLYVDYWNKIKPSGKKHYQGEYPSYRLIKSNAQVIADTIAWLKYIASNNNFHYGHGKAAHKNGCYFCNTQPTSKKDSGMKEWRFTYCCNPFVHAGWAHGGCVPRALKICQGYGSWDFGTGSGSYHTCNLFTNLGKTSNLKIGDVLCSDSHVAIYAGNGKVLQAGHEDDNKKNSSSWNSSISLSKWNGWTRAYRFNSKVDANLSIFYGEMSDRVKLLWDFMNWYFDGSVGKADRYYGDRIMGYVKRFQKEQGLVPDGIVGPKTIDAMKKVEK